MKALFLAPLPPPITGHSLASKVFLEALAQRHETAVVDLGADSMHDGTVTFRRIWEVLKLLACVLRRQKDADVVYLTISESLAGNAKDLMIYLLCARRLSRFVIHLHGGSIRRLLFDRWPWVERINRMFVRRMAAVVVTGRSHAEIFAGMIAPERIHYVPNFADEALFVDEASVWRKFSNPEPLRVLFVSAMEKAKGAPDLIAAYRLLPAEFQHRIRIDAAGRFGSAEDHHAFEASIAGLEGVYHHGVVEGAAKLELFAKAHIFCLPTAMFEGQPISILEAYASGCAVLTTAQPGILDVFADGVNGYQIGVHDPASIASALAAAASDLHKTERIALENLRTAKIRYRSASFSEGLTAILERAAA